MLDRSALRALFDPLPQPVLFVEGGAVTYRNAAAASLLGVGEPGEPVPEELSPLLAEEAVSASCTAGGRSWTVSVSRADEGGLYLFQGGAPAEAPVDESLLFCLLDQTRQQVGNLVAAVHLLTPELRAGGERKNDQYLSIMNQSFYRLMRLMDGAETALALGGDGLGWHPAPLDLAGLCRELCRQVEPLAESAARTFRWEVEEGSLLTVGDAELLRRLALSLLSNALRAADRGGEAGLRLTRSAQRAVLTVWDSGAGLRETVDDETFPRVERGLGVGLAAARRIAALHGGTLVLESAAGKGVRATASLPIQPPPRSTALHTAPPRVDRTGGFSPVLVELADLLPCEAFGPDDID